MFSIGLSWLEFAAFIPARLPVTMLHIGKPMYLIHVTMFLDVLLHGLHFDMCVGLTCRFAVLQVSHPTCIVVQLPLAGQSFILLVFVVLLRDPAGISTASCSHVNALFSKTS